MPRKRTTKTKTEKVKAAKKLPSMEVHEEAELQAEQEGQQTIESVVNQSFFYTSDKFFDQIDANEIKASIIKTYPKLSTDNTDSVIKKTLIEMLNNEDFMTGLLNFYNITIFELFKILHTTYSSIFKGTYLKKVKANLSGKSYVSIQH